MVTEQRDQKITYTTMSVEQAGAFNQAFDDALTEVRSRLGQSYPAHINGRPVTAGPVTFESRSPNDRRILLGAFQECREAEADAAVRAAHQAFQDWAHRPWQERVGILRAAAQNFRSRKYELGAWLSLEAGKPRLESIGEIEEAADLLSTYCDQMERHSGFAVRLGQLSPEETNHSVLRPYGVWAVVAPFNFPAALATGMMAGALVSGNTVVFKPSSDTPLTGVKVYECLSEAGLPPGVLNMVTGAGNETGEALSNHPLVRGIAFTGSREVGTHIYSEFSRNYPRPCVAEMGGKNPVLVAESADMDKAVEGTARAAFGYSGQKCSAASRVYVHKNVADEFERRLVGRTESLLVGDPTRADVFMGPVINQRAYDRFQDARDTAQRDGEILTGGYVLTEGDLQYGFYCTPTIADLPASHRFFYEELFVPLLVMARVSSLDEALELANDSEYGLTAGIFTEDRDEMATFLDRIEAGVVYVNRKGGATSGAWPGAQTFGGWKASGSTGKNAFGPYYVQQFMHEQSQTVVEG